MTDFSSIEQIEGMDSSAIIPLKELASSLHEATIGVLSTPMTSQDAEREQELRESLILKLSEAINDLDFRIADMEAVKKDLRIVKGYAASDKRRLENYRFSLLIAEKVLRQRP